MKKNHNFHYWFEVVLGLFSALSGFVFLIYGLLNNNHLDVYDALGIAWMAMGKISLIHAELIENRVMS